MKEEVYTQYASQDPMKERGLSLFLPLRTHERERFKLVSALRTL